jgi:hypothetical protein
MLKESGVEFVAVDMLMANRIRPSCWGCIREKGIKLSAEGEAVLDTLPVSFDAWRADPTPRGTPVAAEAWGPAQNLGADVSGGRYHPVDERTLPGRGRIVQTAGR